MEAPVQLEVITRTGGVDRQGRVLLTLLTSAGPTLASTYAAAQLASFACRRVQEAPPGGAVALLVDARTWKEDAVNLVMEMMRRLRDEDALDARRLYMLAPRSKRAKRLVRKEMAKQPSFHFVTLEESRDLLSYIELSELTHEFGGTLSYNHAHWCIFTEEHSRLEQELRSAVEQLAPADDRLRMLLEYDVPTDQASQHALLQQVRSKYNRLMRDLNLEHWIDACRAALQKLDDPTFYSDVRRTPAFSDAKRMLDRYERVLIPGREQLKSLWQQAEGRIVAIGKMEKYKVKTAQIIDWLSDVGMLMADEPAHVGRSLAEADLYETQFECGFYATGKNVTWLAEKFQRKMELLVLRGGASEAAILTYLQKLRASVDYFRRLLENKRTVFADVVSFHLTSAKISRWFRRTLLFLPTQFLPPLPSGHRPTPGAMRAWHSAVAEFTARHPPPTPQHLGRLRRALPRFPADIRNPARILIHRVEQMCGLLRDPLTATGRDLDCILEWKRSAVLDCARHPPAYNPSIVRTPAAADSSYDTVSTGSRTPKLRASSHRSATLPPGGRLTSSKDNRRGEQPPDVVRFHQVAPLLHEWRSSSQLVDCDDQLVSADGRKLTLSRAVSCGHLGCRGDDDPLVATDGNERYVDMVAQLAPPAGGLDSDSGIARTADSSFTRNVAVARDLRPDPHVGRVGVCRARTSCGINIEDWMERQPERRTARRHHTVAGWTSGQLGDRLTDRPTDRMTDHQCDYMAV